MKPSSRIAIVPCTYIYGMISSWLIDFYLSSCIRLKAIPPCSIHTNTYNYNTTYTHKLQYIHNYIYQQWLFACIRQKPEVDKLFSAHSNNYLVGLNFSFCWQPFNWWRCEWNVRNAKVSSPMSRGMYYLWLAFILKLCIRRYKGVRYVDTYDIGFYLISICIRKHAITTVIVHKKILDTLKRFEAGYHKPLVRYKSKWFWHKYVRTRESGAIMWLKTVN